VLKKTRKCCSCNEFVSVDKIIKTNEFKEYQSEIKLYCDNCFLANVENGFGKLDNCSICESSLVLQFDNEETIALAQDDFTVHYVCRKVKEATEKNDAIELEKLVEEDHDWLICYTVQPDPSEPDFG